jgi:hypothetical protein
MLSMGKILCDGTKVKLDSLFLIDEEKMEIKIEFDKKNVFYDILAKQNGKIVLDSPGEYLEGGKGVYKTIKLDSDAPLDVIITFQGFGLDDSKTCSIGEKVEFANVIPEFGGIAIMIFGTTIACLMALTLRSKIITRF